MAQSMARVACIAAFSREIARFLGEEELQHLCQVSRLLWSVFELRACRPDPSNRAQGVASLFQSQDALARELRAILQNGRKSTSSAVKSRAKRSKNGFARLRDDQIRSLVLDLVLVGLGVRASCLVDTCQLDEEAVLAMASTFSTHKSWHPYGLHYLSAVLVAGNVFFVHTSEFVRLKCLDLAMELQNAILIDACGELRMPKQISNAANDPGGIRRRLVDATQQLVNSVVDSSVRRRHSPIQLHTNGVCATAVAGIILCYPVIYHVGTTRSTQDSDQFWMTSGNCLGMRPLFLFQISLSLANATDSGLGVRIALQEFSVPQQLASTDNLHDVTVFSPKRVIAQCKRALDRAVGGFESLSIGVEVTTRTLPQIAL